jgi:hypothetical protein
MARAVGLDRNVEPFSVERIDECNIELKERFSPGAHNHSVLAAGFGPRACHSDSETGGVPKTSTANAIHPHEVGVTEFTNRPLAITFSPVPQVATRKPAEHGRAPGVESLALKSIENLLDRVGHVRPPDK